jgi:protein-tyrosine kinase
MSLETEAPVAPENEAQMRAALIAYCELSAEQITSIDAAVLPQVFRYRSFADAAVSLGIVTRSDVSAALDNKSSARAPAAARLIGTRARSNNTAAPAKGLVVYEGEQVRAGQDLGIIHDPFSKRSELIRGLRTKLFIGKDINGEGDTVALVGCVAAEGRSLLAAELAVAYSQLGRKTLLIDADLRMPSLHRLFAADNDRGLSDALTKNESPYTLRVEGLPFLSVLVSGPTAPNPLELLSGAAFQRTLRALRRRYSYIVIDTPPLHHYSDALPVARATGAALMVCRKDRTPIEHMKEALRGLDAAQAAVVGAVVNAF